METRYPVVLLPGGVLPAEPAYAALLQVLGDRVDAVAKDLEVYSGDRPQTDYGLGTEVEGILREAEAHGFDRFHLVGYSGGGASSLAFTAQHGERLLSLALLEPAWAGNDRTAEEEGLWRRFRALEPLPPDQFMAGFVRLQLAPGVEPPPRPEGPPPPWMAKRPAGIRAFLDAFDSEDAVILAICLRDAPEIERAFQAYERLRRPRVERIVKQGARGSSHKAPGPAGRVVRDMMLPLVFRFLVTPRALSWMFDHRVEWDDRVELDTVTD